MTEFIQVYKCNICGNIVEIIHAGQGELVCCGQPMKLKQSNQGPEEYGAKHRPVIEKTETGFKVKIGAVAHPMEEKHYIEWIEVLADSRIYRKFLKPGMAPEAEFCISAENITARMYCNIHGIWKS